jgi:hypothetical protein
MSVRQVDEEWMVPTVTLELLEQTLGQFMQVDVVVEPVELELLDLVVEVVVPL